MPELPEVQTTTNGIKRLIGLKITDIWSDYNSSYFKGKKIIKDPKYFELFKKDIIGAKIIESERRAKNIFIHLDNGYSILIHMKMTGHFLYGKYIFDKKAKRWTPEDQKSPLADPFNRFIRLIFSLSNEKHLAFSDMRRFAKIAHEKTADLGSLPEIKILGPEPLSKEMTFAKFKKQIYSKPKGKIKSILMDQTIISGIGNIYADEILWRSDTHPEKSPEKIGEEKLKKMFLAMKETLKKGIDFGGDSMSDYRNIDGLRGKFQEHHEAYRRTSQKCRKKSCKGRIIKLKIAGRSSHFCDTHQK